MAKVSDREIQESYDRMGMLMDELDDDLIRHIFLEDAPPQGLHQGGQKEQVNAEEDN